MMTQGGVETGVGLGAGGVKVGKSQRETRGWRRVIRKRCRCADERLRSPQMLVIVGSCLSGPLRNGDHFWSTAESNGMWVFEGFR